MKDPISTVFSNNIITKADQHTEDCPACKGRRYMPDPFIERLSLMLPMSERVDFFFYHRNIYMIKCLLCEGHGKVQYLGDHPVDFPKIYLKRLKQFEEKYKHNEFRIHIYNFETDNCRAHYDYYANKVKRNSFFIHTLNEYIKLRDHSELDSDGKIFKFYPTEFEEKYDSTQRKEDRIEKKIKKKYDYSQILLENRKKRHQIRKKSIEFPKIRFPRIKLTKIKFPRIKLTKIHKFFKRINNFINEIIEYYEGRSRRQD